MNDSKKLDAMIGSTKMIESLEEDGKHQEANALSLIVSIGVTQSEQQSAKRMDYKKYQNYYKNYNNNRNVTNRNRFECSLCEFKTYSIDSMKKHLNRSQIHKSINQERKTFRDTKNNVIRNVDSIKSKKK